MNNIKLDIEKALYLAGSMLDPKSPCQDTFWAARRNILAHCQDATPGFQLNLLLVTRGFIRKLADFFLSEDCPAMGDVSSDVDLFIKAAENVENRFFSLRAEAASFFKDVIPQFKHSEALHSLEEYLSYYERHFAFMEDELDVQEELRERAQSFIVSLLEETTLAEEMRELVIHYDLPKENCPPFLAEFAAAQSRFKLYYHYFYPVKDVIAIYRAGPSAFLIYGKQKESWLYIDPVSPESEQIKKQENSFFDSLKQAMTPDDFDSVPVEPLDIVPALPADVLAGLNRELDRRFGSDGVITSEEEWDEYIEELTQKGVIFSPVGYHDMVIGDDGIPNIPLAAIRHKYPEALRGSHARSSGKVDEAFQIAVSLYYGEVFKGIVYGKAQVFHHLVKDGILFVSGAIQCEDDTFLQRASRIECFYSHGSVKLEKSFFFYIEDGHFTAKFELTSEAEERFLLFVAYLNSETLSR